MSRVILHCDMNNFFASVECMMNPELAGKFVAVCGSVEERHGIVLAKNEAAKKCGVKTGEAIWEAKRKCPELVVVAPHFENYAYYSNKAKEIYSRYTDLVESFGMDECWLDVTGSVKLFGNGEKIADEIRCTIKKELGLTVSVGVSFNKVFAKLGSDLKKPDATTVISEDNFRELIYDLPASELLGVGRATFANINRIGVDTIGELAALPRETMRIRMGKHGDNVWRYANGLDNSPVMRLDCDVPIKSIGRGLTTSRDLVNYNDVKRLILFLSCTVARKLREHHFIASGVQIAIRNNKLITHEYQCRLTPESNSASVIATEAAALFKARYDWKNNIRSVTVRAINLLPDIFPRQLDMQCDINKLERTERIDCVTDEIIRRFGKNSIKPMSLIGLDHIPEPRPDYVSLPGFNISG